METADKVTRSGDCFRLPSSVDAGLDPVYQGVGDVDAGVHVVPKRRGCGRVGVDSSYRRGERRGIIIPGAVGVVGSDSIFVRAIVQHGIGGLVAEIPSKVLIDAHGKSVDSFIRVEVVRVTLGGEFFFEEILATGRKN